MVTAIATLAAAVAGLVYQIRQLRADVVSSVEKHLIATVAAINEQKGRNPNDTTK